MLSSILALLLAATPLAFAQNYTSTPYPPFSGDPFQKYNLEAEGIKASFIPYGARLTNLYVKDKNGQWQDIAVGYDSGRRYLHDTETAHTYFGAVVGRYANRIKNGTFTINGVTSHIPENENNGEDTLHGGFVGYDQQNWTVASLSGNSITFSFYDAAQSGFPGDVLNIATYTLTDDASWISRMVSFALNEETPIMLANHVYWNLGAFEPGGTLILNNELYMPYADRYIEIDGIEVPTGGIAVANGTYLDFATAPKTIGADIKQSVNGCGTGCVGYDNAFILDRPRYSGPEDPGLEVLQLWSPVTGIKMSLETNQQGLQIYSCNGQDGTIPVKRDQMHGGGNGTQFVEKYGCIVIETQDWIDGINQPQWGRQQWQLYSPTTEPAVNYQKYTFTVE